MGALADFFDHARTQFQAACEQAGCLEQSLTVAHTPLKVCFAGESMLVKLWPALAHLQTPACATVDLTVQVWDSASAGGMISPPPWESLAYVERAQIRRYQDDRFFLAYDRNTNLFMGFDRLRAEAIYWTRDVTWIPYFERAAPMRHLLQAWLNPRGLYLCHGAAIGVAGGAVMLAGRGGMGKSTTALLGLQDGFDFFGDDFILLADTSPPMVHNLYNSGKLNADSVQWLPDLQPLVTNAQEIGPWEKALLFLHPTYQAQLAAQLPLKAIVLPQRSIDAAPSLAEIKGAEAYGMLAPDTIFRGQGDAQGVLHFYRRLLHALPTYRLNLGNDPGAIPPLLRALLQSA